jgi:hypothetical protein
VRLTADGHATAEVHTRYTGNRQDHIREALAARSGHDREVWLHDHLDLPSFELVAVDYSSIEARASAAALPLTLKLPRYAARTGKRLFLPVNLMERWSAVPPPAEARTQPVQYFPYPFVDADTIRYELPAGFTAEAVPDPATVETSFGRYEAHVVAEPDHTLVYYRRVEIHQATIPAEEYDTFRDFLRQIAQADRAQVVLVTQ